MGSVSSNDNFSKPSFNRKNFNEFYELGKKIGVGSFATVNKCYRKNDSAEFAVKIINKYFLSHKELIGLRNEIQILRKISHKNVIKLIDVFDDGQTVFMVLELCNGKDLFDEIVSSKQKHFSEKKSAEIIHALAHGLQHLHEQGVAHRDLKPENILFGLDGTIKITDFGLARFFRKLSNESSENSSQNIFGYESTLLYTSCGSSHYVAPEVLANNGYDNKCDIWSVGVILYILLVGYQPFNAKSVCAIYKLIAKGDYNFDSNRWDNISDEAKNLVTCLLEVDVTKRYSANDIQCHPWIKKNIDIGSNHNKLK
eukprot:UN00335